MTVLMTPSRLLQIIQLVVLLFAYHPGTLVLAFCVIPTKSRRQAAGRTSPSRNDIGRTPLSLLATTDNVGTLQITRSNTTSGSTPTTNHYQLAYRIARPMALSSRQAAPVVVLHGGPSVPSDYLYPLQQVLPYRSIIYYDQIGCGRSDEPKDVAEYSIEYALDDLEALLKKLGVRRCHLYGQSFGGILAYEYMKRLAERTDKGNSDGVVVLSAILSSSPTSVQMVQDEADLLLLQLQNSTEQFRQLHQCRTSEWPQPLADAYAHAGSVWRGTTAIYNYVATPPKEGASRMPPCMVMRGEYDFVSQRCIEGWRQCFNHGFSRTKVLEGCSHHGLLERATEYGEVVDSYFAEYD